MSAFALVDAVRQHDRAGRGQDLGEASSGLSLGLEAAFGRGGASHVG